jgi:hypothetical protein
MIYVENDFYSNFNGAVKADDDTVVQSMMVDQISNLIAKRRGEVIQLFQKIGIKLSQNPSNEEISDRLVRSLKSSKKLQVGLAYLIAKDNNILGGTERKSNVDGALEQKASDACERTYEKALKKYATTSNPFPDEASRAMEECKKKYIARKTNKVDWNKASGTIFNIADTIGQLADTFGGGGANRFKNNLQNQTNVKNPQWSGQGYGDNPPLPPKKKYTWLWISLGVVAVGGLGYLAYRKGMFEKKG